MFNIDELRHQIEAMIREYELADDEVLRTDTLVGATDIDEALTSLVHDIHLSEDLLEGTIKRRKKLGERRDRLKRRIARFRELILKVLQSADLRRVTLPEVTLVQTILQPQIVGEPDADALPDDLVRIKRVPNLTAIRQALLDHREIPGLSLSNAPPGLMIRAR